MLGDKVNKNFIQRWGKMKSCFFCFYRHLNIPEVVICLWKHLTGNAEEGPMENIETICPGGVASLGRVLLGSVLTVKPNPAALLSSFLINPFLLFNIQSPFFFPAVNFECFLYPQTQREVIISFVSRLGRDLGLSVMREQSFLHSTPPLQQLLDSAQRTHQVLNCHKTKSPPSKTSNGFQRRREICN